VDVAQIPRMARSRFHPRLQILWIEGYDLIQREPIWLPFETIHTNYTIAMRGHAGDFIASSNGLASGNHILEAISHALCEVVERDAMTLWYRKDEAAQRQTRLDLTTIDDHDCQAVLERYARADIAVGVWEITSEVGIPGFQCQIVDRAEDPLRPLYSAFGAGCHPTRAIALLRALHEAAQSRLTIITGARDDWFRADYARWSSPDVLQANRARIAEQPPARAFASSPSWESDSFGADVAWELERLRAAGLQRAVMVDLTRPEFGLPVVKLVIPGLEPLASKEGYIAGSRALAQMRDRQ
jgi:ribosomal protein S12 methylthiotransferase accessory factor